MHLLKTLSLVAILSLLFFACIKDDGEREMVINYIKIDDQVPAFAVKDTGGNTFNAKFAGKQSLLVFFGSYCPDCKRVLPVIEDVWKEMKNDPKFQLIPVSRKESVEDVVLYWNENQFTMPFYLDPEGTAFALFANNTIPRIYIINPDNVVTWMSVESLDLSAKELIRIILSQ